MEIYLNSCITGLMTSSVLVEILTLTYLIEDYLKSNGTCIDSSYRFVFLKYKGRYED